jgi:hypothetical protein
MVSCPRVLVPTAPHTCLSLSIRYGPWEDLAGYHLAVDIAHERERSLGRKSHCQAGHHRMPHFISLELGIRGEMTAVKASRDTH